MIPGCAGSPFVPYVKAGLPARLQTGFPPPASGLQNCPGVFFAMTRCSMADTKKGNSGGSKSGSSGGSKSGGGGGSKSGGGGAKK